ncbi:Scr1 family TA system antitoxin-like transcriptional regulator [Streptomyces sp. Ag109_O5-10]|uniref:Scr1 family TA system antitoxin-like transcriptional regulator n=1 Tax=Streptomyces sp. Ag109_O5-10 TaxID=1855349 RepID=UPI000AA89525
MQHRLRRKAVLDGKPFDAIIHEAALRIMVGDRAASRAQLSEVLEASEADNVTVRVIPFTEEGFAGAASAMLYAGGAVSKLDTVVRDGPNGAAYVDSEGQLGALRTLLRTLEAASLNPDRSRDLINRVAKEL